MGDAPSVSIIMPVYGVEKYIAKAIESVLCQTFTQFELIIVDDCSLDNSADIARQYAAKDSRIKMLRAPKNLGLGGARNLGLNAAIGDYVLFVDSDDYIDTNAVAELYCVALEYDAQVIISGYYEVYCDGSGTVREEVPVCPPYTVFKGSDQVHRQVAQLDASTVGRFAWNKLYQCQFLVDNELMFESVEPIEDICFNLKVYNCAQSLVTIDKPLYFYFKRANTQTLSVIYNDKLFSLFKERYNRIMEYHMSWGISDDDILQINYNIYVRHIVVLIQKISMSGLDRRDKTEKIKTIVFDPATRECIQNMKFTSVKYAVLKLLIGLKAIRLILFLSKLAYTVKIVFPKFYAKLRSKG